MMESKFLENTIYQKPEAAFLEVIERLQLEDDLAEKLSAYLQDIYAAGANVKDDSHQEAMQPILEELLQTGRKEEAGLLFNMHRTWTEFRGYGSNDKASNDVEAFFQNGLEIPEEGLIVFDFFATRNLPKTLELLEERGVDLSRVRVVVPKGILAAQLMGMSDEKKREVEEAFSKLEDSQMLIEDVNHVGDIQVEGDVALWFSPRTMPINPRLHAETEAGTIDNFVEAFRTRASQVVESGRIFANLAYSDEWKELGVETAGKRRNLTKLTGISKAVAEAVVAVMLDMGFKQIKKGEFAPSDIDPEIDHSKMASWLHFVNEAA